MLAHCFSILSQDFRDQGQGFILDYRSPPHLCVWFRLSFVQNQGYIIFEDRPTHTPAKETDGVKEEGS